MFFGSHKHQDEVSQLNFDFSPYYNSESYTHYQPFHYYHYKKPLLDYKHKLPLVFERLDYQSHETEIHHEFDKIQIQQSHL